MVGTSEKGLKLKSTYEPKERLSFNDWHKYIRQQVNESKGLKI